MRRRRWVLCVSAYGHKARFAGWTTNQPGWLGPCSLCLSVCGDRALWGKPIMALEGLDLELGHMLSAKLYCALNYLQLA